MKSFAPIDRATTTIAASTTSARGAIAVQPTSSHQVRICNVAGALAYYRICDASGMATNADIPLPDGALEVITVEASASGLLTHIAVILASGTGKVFVTTGHGI